MGGFGNNRARDNVSLASPAKTVHWINIEKRRWFDLTLLLSRYGIETINVIYMKP